MAEINQAAFPIYVLLYLELQWALPPLECTLG